MTTEAPTVYLRIADSSIAFDERGEVIETNDYNDDGSPDWANGGVCDARGGGGQEAFTALHTSLTQAEENARLVGFDVRRIPEEAIS